VAQKQNTPGAFASGVSVSAVAGIRTILTCSCWAKCSQHSQD
jgi:hypothetical protein